MGVGDSYTSEVKVFLDEEYGYTLIRPLDTGLNRTLYFTSNPFLDDGEHLIISSNINECDNLYKLNFITGEYIQLTDEPNIHTTLSYLDRCTNILYCRTDKKIFSVNIDTLEYKVILKLDDISKEIEGLGPSIAITCDGKYVLAEHEYIHKFRNNDGELIKEKMWRILKIDIETLKQSDVLYANYKVDHIQCSPTDPEYLTYCAWGYWPTHHRVWGTNIYGTKGGPLGEEKPNEHRTHEYFTNDGSQIAYHGKFFVMESNKFKKIRDTYGIMSADGTNDREWICPKGYAPGHSTRTPNGDKVIADGRNKISILEFNDEHMTCTPRPIYTHNSSMTCNEVHPHPSISKDGRYICFVTDQGKGKEYANVYIIDLESK
ncbi:oligogalacturonate lyase family protein [Vallitalea okinawensis]|uniref:oligogalacturonate lyase family protein n=1 Tax=Vallitalea okinawensis TaxID=2078660 RepID=UPI000CFCBE04|nr:oligogalacturonate lyase family protein [Vallitalea okinawensis]